MAGILPLAIHNDKLYFLFSREYGKKDWRDFGGKCENNETLEETAARECWEESSGFLGTQNNIAKLIKTKLLAKIVKKTYTIFVVLIDYDKDLPQKFSEHFKKMYKNDKTKICKNGFYEKDKLKWISIDKLPKYYHMFLPWYRKLVKKIYKEFI